VHTASRREPEQPCRKEKNPGARACNVCELNPHQWSPHEAPGECLRGVAPGSKRSHRSAQTSAGSGQPRGEALQTEQIVLKPAPTTFNNRVTPRCGRGGHGDGDCTVWPRTQTMKKKKSISGTTPHPRRASASAPLEGRKEGGHRPATRDDDGNEKR
jgi:hypothetical protein